MMKRPLLMTCAVLLPLAACNGGGETEQDVNLVEQEVGNATAPAAPGQAAQSGGATATLQDASGTAKGTATVSEAGGDLRVQVQATGLPQGTHGIHVHATGTCSPPDFTSAGPHWNPTDKAHGTEDPDGYHLGDLPNIDIGADGNGSLEYTISSGTFAQLFDGDGAAVVIHAKADDYRTDPSGDSGDRIACGVLERSGAAAQG